MTHNSVDQRGLALAVAPFVFEVARGRAGSGPAPGPAICLSNTCIGRARVERGVISPRSCNDRGQAGRERPSGLGAQDVQEQGVEVRDSQGSPSEAALREAKRGQAAQDGCRTASRTNDALVSLGQRFRIRLLIGDRMTAEVSPDDLTGGRITFRYEG